MTLTAEQLAEYELRATMAERERCAKIADSFTCGACGMDGKAGAAIRRQSLTSAFRNETK